MTKTIADVAKPALPESTDRDPDEKLISLTELPLVSGRQLRVKMQTPDATRILIASAKPDRDVLGNLRVRVNFSVDFKDETGR